MSAMGCMMALLVSASTPATLDDGGGAPASVPRPKLRAGLTLGPGFALGARSDPLLTGGPAAFKLAPQFQAIWPLGNQVAIAAVLPLTMHFSDTEVTGALVRALGVEFVPTVRALFELAPKFRLSAGFGLGLAHYESTFRVIGGESGYDTDFLQLYLGFGGEYALTEHLVLMFEPAAIRANTVGRTHVAGSTRYAGDVPSEIEYGIQLGAAYEF